MSRDITAIKTAQDELEQAREAAEIAALRPGRAGRRLALAHIEERLLDTVGHHVREAAKFAPERPAIWLGLRTAAATAIPLLIARWIDPVAASWAPLAGFIVALVDKGIWSD